MAPRDAMRIAGERQLDLIEIAPNAVPPVCKIVEYGKFKYEHQKREKVVRKQTHVTLVKEVRLHPNIDSHDVDFKTKHSRQFLLDGNKVKITVVFKGREMAYKQRGEKVLRQFVETLADIAKVENDIRMEGNRMSVMIAPSGAVKAKVKPKAPKTDQPKVDKPKTDKPKAAKAASETVAEAPATAEQASEGNGSAENVV